MKNILGKIFGTLVLIAVLVAPPARALDMFLDIPGIPGESTTSLPLNQIDVLAWSWGMSNPGSAQIGGGGGAVKANFQDLSLTKYVDKASPLLMLRCANGAHISKVTLYVRKAGSKPTDYIKIIMTEVLVTSVSTGGSGGEDRLTENISLNFAQVEFDYTPTTPDGTTDTPVVFQWDIAGNVAP
jgi:type VI secretion system secreted protein Hcp